MTSVSPSATPAPSSPHVDDRRRAVHAQLDRDLRPAVADGVVEQRVDDPLEQVGLDRDRTRVSAEPLAGSRFRPRRLPGGGPRLRPERRLAHHSSYGPGPLPGARRRRAPRPCASSARRCGGQPRGSAGSRQLVRSLRSASSRLGSDLRQRSTELVRQLGRRTSARGAGSPRGARATRRGWPRAA